MADVKDLRGVLDAIKEYGLSAHVVRVGDIVLQLSKPWPVAVATEKEQPKTDEEQMTEEVGPHQAQAKRLALLRELSKKQFNRVLPDKELELMAPVLLQGSVQ